MDLIEKLMKLGLSEYEAKIYVVLVGLDEASAREIHEGSKVPRTRVYDILEKLVEKGFVEVQQGNPTYYRAIEPEKTIEKQIGDLSKITRECIEELEKLQIARHRDLPLFWMVRGDWTIKTKIQELISEAREEISIACLNTEILHEISGMLDGQNKKIRCLLTRRDSEIMNKIKKAEFKTTGKSSLAKIIESMEKIDEEEIKFKMECLIIADNRKSIIIIEENGKRSAVLIRLPIIAYIQKTFYDTIWINEE